MDSLEIKKEAWKKFHAKMNQLTADKMRGYKGELLRKTDKSSEKKATSPGDQPGR